MTKKEAGQRGIPCSWDTCREPAVWKVLDSHGQLVRYWCETHHQNMWKVHSHPGLSSVLIGGVQSPPTARSAGPKSYVDVAQEEVTRGAQKEIPSPSPGSRRDPHADDPPASAKSPGDSGRGSVGAASAGGYDRGAEVGSGRALTTTPRPTDDTTPAQAVLPPSTPTLQWWQGAGDLQLNPEQQAILWEAVDPEEVDIYGSGKIYLGWTWYYRRWLRAFSPYLPALIPLTRPMKQDNLLCQEWVAVVNGHYIGHAVGECELPRSNYQMTWGDVATACKSNAIMRISKDLGMAQELWDRTWTTRWCAKYAIAVQVAGYRNKQWRRIDSEPVPGEIVSKHQGQSEYDRPQRLEDEVGEHFDSIGREPGQEG